MEINFKGREFLEPIFIKIYTTVTSAEADVAKDGSQNWELSAHI